LGIGEAVITVMDERGAPTPVAWTRLSAPESLMAMATAAAMEASVQASPLHGKYAEDDDRQSAHEMIHDNHEAGPADPEAENAAQGKVQDRESGERGRQE